MSEAGYRQEKINHHRGVFVKHDKDKDGRLQEGEMYGFIKELWGLDDRGFSSSYWKAINGYDSRRQGVSVEDFTTCWIWFDWQAFEPPAGYAHNYNNPAKPKAHDFGGKVHPIIEGIRSFWRTRP